MPWRVYRPAIVVGHSETGDMDKVDGPYYLFPLIKRMRDNLPALAAAGRRRPRRHQRGAGRLRRQGDGPPRPPARPRRRGVPPGQPRAAAHGRDGQLVLQRPPMRRRSRPRSTGGPRGCTAGCSPGRCARSTLLNAVIRTAPAQQCSSSTIGRLGIPAEVLSHTSFPPVFDSRRTERALAGSGIAVPDLDGYARTLWGYWEENLDETTGRDPKNREALQGKYVVITGASSGIGKVTALKVAQCRRHPGPGRARQGQARGHQGGDRAARRPGPRLRLRPLRPRGDRRALQGDHRRAARRSTSWSTTPAARSGAR